MLEKCGLGGTKESWYTENQMNKLSLLFVAISSTALALPTVRLSPRMAVPVSVTASVDGTPVFGDVDVGMFYRKNWNMFRLMGRGLADSAESPVVQILPDSFTILMR